MGVPFSVTNMALEPMPQRMPLTFGEDWNVISAWMDAFHGRTIMCSGQEDPGDLLFETCWLFATLRCMLLENIAK